MHTSPAPIVVISHCISNGFTTEGHWGQWQETNKHEVMGGSITRRTPLWFLGIEGQDTEKGFDVRTKQERSFGKNWVRIGYIASMKSCYTC